MASLITADVHMNGRERDEHRWELWGWLLDQVRALKIDTLLVLGDLTDAKDRHDAVLVNRLADALAKLADECRVVVLMGNHDHVDPSWPFFDFLRHTGMSYISSPRKDVLKIADTAGSDCLLLPSTTDYKKAWATYENVWNEFDYIFCHQTFTGAMTETGTKLNGVPTNVFEGFKGKVWSGDIHVPQRLGQHIEYVGSPYRVRFGDAFTPRVVHIDRKGKATGLTFPTINLVLADIHNMHDLEKVKARKYDQVKVRVRLPRSEYPDWPKLRKDIMVYAASRDWGLYGPSLVALEEGPTRNRAATEAGHVDPLKRVGDYAKAKAMPADAASAGAAIIKKLTKGK